MSTEFVLNPGFEILFPQTSANHFLSFMHGPLNPLFIVETQILPLKKYHQRIYYLHENRTGTLEMFINLKFCQ